MKIEVKNIDGSEDNDYRDAISFEVNGKRMLTFRDGEPEDNSLCRNFNDVFSIAGVVKLAYEAGNAGEELTIEHTNVEEF